MTCRECREELELWIGQAELPKEIQDHIGSCAECQKLWDDLRGLASSLAEDSAFQATATEAHLVQTEINRRLRTEAHTAITPLHWLRHAAVAASVIIVAGIGITGYRANWFSRSVSTPDTTVVAQADTQTRNVATEDFAEGLNDDDLSALERAVDSAMALDDATVLDSLSDEQIQYLESHLDVRGLI